MYKGIVFEVLTNKIIYLIENVSLVTANSIEGANLILERIDPLILGVVVVDGSIAAAEGDIVPEGLIDVKDALILEQDLRTRLIIAEGENKNLKVTVTNMNQTIMGLMMVGLPPM